MCGCGDNSGGHGGNGGGNVADIFQDDRGRVLCCDRKGFFDHLRTKSLILSVSQVKISLGRFYFASFVFRINPISFLIDNNILSIYCFHIE